MYNSPACHVGCTIYDIATTMIYQLRYLHFISWHGSDVGPNLADQVTFANYGPCGWSRDVAPKRNTKDRLSIWPWIKVYHCRHKIMDVMTSSNGNIFRVTGLLCGTSHRWIPRTKASDAELWCFLWSAPEPTVEQSLETPVIWDALIMTSF